MKKISRRAILAAVLAAVLLIGTGWLWGIGSSIAGIGFCFPAVPMFMKTEDWRSSASPTATGTSS